MLQCAVQSGAATHAKHVLQHVLQCVLRCVLQCVLRCVLGLFEANMTLAPDALNPKPKTKN